MRRDGQSAGLGLDDDVQAETRVESLTSLPDESMDRLGVAEDELARLRAVVEAVREEIAHAEANGHRLANDCQGVGFDPVPAVRIEYLNAALGRETLG